MRILLVKLSSLGDVVHTLPVVQDILAAMPDAQIDWVVEKAFAPLLTQVKGLRRIIPCELRRWRKSFLAAQTWQAWRAFKADLQSDSYDAVIDLQGLTKSAVVARLARLTPQGKRYAMANQTDGSGYEAPTRWLADVAIELPPHVHAVQRGRDLAARALGYRMKMPVNFGLNYSSNMPIDQSIRVQEAPKIIAIVMLNKTPPAQAGSCPTHTQPHARASRWSWARWPGRRKLTWAFAHRQYQWQARLWQKPAPLAASVF